MTIGPTPRPHVLRIFVELYLPLSKDAPEEPESRSASKGSDAQVSGKSTLPRPSFEVMLDPPIIRSSVPSQEPPHHT